MSDFVEDCVRVPPLSTAAIEELANAFLAELAPVMLSAPQALDLVSLVDDGLNQQGIVIYPATLQELGDREGATRPSSPIEVLLAEHLWNALHCGGPGQSRARSTLGHELGHCVLHVPLIRRALSIVPEGFTLNRAERGSVKAFEDSEWQAYTFSGCILMPRTTLVTVPSPSVSRLAALYNLSAPFVRSHLKRLKLACPEW